MNIETNKTETITWDIEGCKATASTENTTIKNVVIAMLSGGASGDNRMQATDEQFIRDVHKALTELINHVDKQRNVGNPSIDNGIESMSVTLTDEGEEHY